jgi:hypothetical protein
VLGTNVKKPLHVALNELYRETATRLAFKYFSRVRRVSLLYIRRSPPYFSSIQIAQDAQAHGCSILHGDAEHIDADTNPIRQVVLHPPTSAREALAHTCDICLSIHLYHRALLLNYHNILARVEVLTIISTTTTTTTTTCLARPEAKLKDHMTIPRQTKTATTATLTTRNAGADSSGARGTGGSPTTEV